MDAVAFDKARFCCIVEYKASKAFKGELLMPPLPASSKVLRAARLVSINWSRSWIYIDSALIIVTRRLKAGGQDLLERQIEGAAQPLSMLKTPSMEELRLAPRNHQSWAR